MSDGEKDFNLLDEWARGIMYRGGEEMEEFISGYVLGMLLYGGVAFVLFVIGVIFGS